MLLYYITDRRQFPGSEGERTARLLYRIAEAAAAGVDFIQLREKDLPTKDLESLAHAALERVRSSERNTRLLINSRADVALAVGADGVHLRSCDMFPEQVRRIWRWAGANNDPIISVSCHTEPEIAAAEANGADFAVFAPVFAKKDVPATAATGLDKLHSACRHKIPVLALGGVNAKNAYSCVDAGATGIAGIRLFQEGNLEDTLKTLRR